MPGSKSVIITGGSGLIGSRLSEMLVDEGYKVQHLSRSASTTSKFARLYWSVEKGELDPDVLAGRLAVIHLAGASIADKRWSNKYKKEIRNSRIHSSELLRETIAKLKPAVRPKVFLSASAVGFYGNRNDEELSEESSSGSGFLAEVVQLWESAVQKIEKLGPRTAIFRLGVVLTKKGGALEKMALPVKFGIGSPLGSGRQFISWIHVDDLCRLLIEALKNENYSGVFNAVSPRPAANREFTKTLARVLKRPMIFPPVPEFALKGILGEMSSILLDGQRVFPEKAVSLGFKFKYPKLKPALKNLLSDR